MQFDSIEEVLDWAVYKKRLKADLQKLKSGKVKFVYYEKFTFGDKKVRPLLLVGKPKNKGVLKDLEECKPKPQKLARGVCFRATDESGEAVIRFLATKGTPDEPDLQKTVNWSGLSDRVKLGQGTEADEAEAESESDDEVSGAAAGPATPESVPAAPPTAPAAGPTATPPAAPPVAPVVEEAKDASAEFKGRLQTLMPEIQAAVAAGGPRGAELKLRASEAGACVRAKDLGRAGVLLDQIEALLKAAPGDSAAGSGAVEASAVWRAAKDAVDAQLNAFVNTMRQTGHAGLMKLADAGLAGVTDDTGRASVALQVSLLEFQSAQGEKRRKAGDDLQNAVKAYRAYVNGSEAVKVCDTNELFPLTVGRTLLDALSKLERLVNSASA